MAKVTISIEGTSEEISQYIQRLSGAKVQQQTSGVSWLPEEIQTLYNHLKPVAKQVWREVAVKPDGYERDELLEKLHMSGKAMAGGLSSVEFNRKRFFPSKPRPMRLDWDAWEYKMLPEVADWTKANVES